jgi:hypothetical protein
MNKVRDKARLHPATVSNYQNHVTKPRRLPRQLRGPSYQIKVDPRVWKVAKQLAKGDTARLVIVSDTEVVVRNPTHD